MRVLIADDDAANRRLLEVTLARWGYQAELTRDGAETWKLLQRDDAPQLVILDWMMPKIDGLEICRRVRQSVPRLVYIIILTAKGQKEDVVVALKAGADDYVTKPFERDELKARVEVGVRVLKLQEALAGRERDLAVAQTLITEKERFDAAVSEMSDGIVGVDGSWQVATANRAARLLLNLSPDSWQGTPLEEVLVPFALSRTFDEISSDADRVIAFEIARTHTQPPLYLDARLTRVCDSAGNMVSGIMTVRDVTMERHSQHVRANFFVMVSHKLRTPITVTKGYLDLMKRLPPGQLLEQWRQILEVCDEEIRRLEDTVQKLLEIKQLTFTQLESEAAQTHVKMVVDATGEWLRDLHAAKRIELIPEIAQNASEVSASPEHLRLVLEKLLDNAAKFADKDPVRIRVAVTRDDAAFNRFSIHDNGPGIPHEYYDRILQGFVQVEDRTTGRVPGIGVGLWVVKQIVGAYGGSISIHSSIGEGSTISFALPSSMGDHDREPRLGNDPS